MVRLRGPQILPGTIQPMDGPQGVRDDDGGGRVLLAAVGHVTRDEVYEYTASRDCGAFPPSGVDSSLQQEV